MEIWASYDLKREWEEAISQKAVLFFEKYVNAKCAYDCKYKKEHSESTGIPLKYIKRSIKYLENIGLLYFHQEGDFYTLEFFLPVSKRPPKDAERPKI